MGNIFCGDKEESTRASAFQSTDRETAETEAEPPVALVPQHSTSMPEGAEGTDQQEEEARLQVVLQTAGRAMVSVRSTRGSTAYYDQGFAAALYQHLEQTTQFPESLPSPLPPANTTSSVYSRLSRPPWQDIVLGKQQVGLAGCAGENPNTYMDHEALTFLDQVRPKKERLFAGTTPMVENLL